MAIRVVKPEIRIIGWDDAPFTFRDKRTLIIGTVFRGGRWLEGVLSAEIEVDGTDCTRKIIKAVRSTPHFQQLRVIMLDGVTFGGFNVADIREISEKTRIPVIVVVRDKPDFRGIRKALGRFKDGEERFALMLKAGELESLNVKNPKTGRMRKIWFQCAGIEAKTAERVIRISSTRSFIPEPLRVSHLMGYGLRGERVV